MVERSTHFAMSYDHTLRMLLDEEPDRSVPIVGMALLDSMLETLITTAIVTRPCSTARALLAPAGPLGSTSAKLMICYAASIIEKDLFSELQTLSEIRNQFAHRLEVSTFDSAAVTPKLMALKRAALPGKPRERFVEACCAAARELSDAIFHAARPSVAGSA